MLLGSLREQAPWLDLAGHEHSLAGSDDLFDAVVASLTARAVVASLTARAVAVGRTQTPDEAHGAAARMEGWMHLPTGALAELPA